MDYILKQEKGKGYKVDSIRGFDFFPQTHHVESVAVLTWVESEDRSVYLPTLDLMR